MVQPFIAVDGSHSATLLDHCLLVDRQIDQDFEIVDKCKIRASVLGVEKDLFSAINNCLELQSFRGFVTRKLHLMLHGRAGALRFAGQWFDLAALIACKSEIKSWGLDEIVLWSCYAGVENEFLRSFSEVSGGRVFSANTWLGRQDGAEKLSVGGYELSTLVDLDSIKERFVLSEENCLPNAISHVTYRLKAADDEIFYYFKIIIYLNT